MKIQLIHPPLDKQYTGKTSKAVQSIPIGLELIAKATELRNPGAEISVIDGNVAGLENVLQSVKDVKADWVGVSDWYSNHRNALTILEKAKTLGAITVMGGPNATHLSERILANNGFVDHVVRGDGEEALNSLVSSGIPGEKKDYHLDLLFDLEHIDYSVYDRDVHLPTSFIRGCIKAAQEERCSFCSIEHSLKLMDPKLAWQQVDILTRYGFNYFFETGDSFMVGNFPERLLRARPDHLKNTTFRIYASPDQITPENIKILKKLGVSSMFLGLETPDENILRLAGKSHTKQDMDMATNLMAQENMRLYAPFIYGLPGTTAETMERTYEYAAQLSEQHPDMAVHASVAVPIIGSQLFKDLAADPKVMAEYQGDLLEDDHLDYKQLARLQTKYRTSVSHEDAEAYVQKTRGLVRKDRRLGFGE